MRATRLWLLVFAHQCWANCPTDTICEERFDRCYRFMGDGMDFFSAEDTCTGLGGHLVSIRSAFEGARVGETAKSMFVGSDGYWIGANYMINPYWSWTDGSMWGYTNWFPDNPTVEGAVYVSTASDLWSSAAEDLTKPFVCGLPYVASSSTQCPVCATCPTTPPLSQCPTTATPARCPACPSTTAAPKATCPTTPAPAPRKALCDDGWTHFGETGSCYKPVIKRQTFPAAEKACNTFGAHLASIHSETESNFIAGIASAGVTLTTGDQTWVGLYRVSSTWYWTDESEMDYSKWKAYEPNNNGGNEACVMLYTDYTNDPVRAPYYWRWNDYACTASLRNAVCKKAQM